MITPQQYTDQQWMKNTLKFAGWYNLIWGSWVILFPNAFFNLLELPRPTYPGIWQCLGMVIGVYGIAYLIAAKQPITLWAITFVGLLGKIFGPIGFTISAISDELPWRFGSMILFNDLIWWVPFAIISWRGITKQLQTNPQPDTEQTNPTSLSEALVAAKTQHGESIAKLSESQTLLIIFLRHGGCIFCREVLTNLSKIEDDLKSKSIMPVVVHMMDNPGADALLGKYNLSHLHHYSDPSQSLYRVFDLNRGTFTQLLGLRVWWTGFKAFLAGHRPGKLQGDVMQLPGAFLVRDSKIIKANRSTHAGDHADLSTMTCEL